MPDVTAAVFASAVATTANAAMVTVNDGSFVGSSVDLQGSRISINR